MDLLKLLVDGLQDLKQTVTRLIVESLMTEKTRGPVDNNAEDYLCI